MRCLCGCDRKDHKIVEGFYGACIKCKSCTHYAVKFSQVGKQKKESE